MATELGQAYVQIIPSAKGIAGSIRNVLDPEATSAGKSGGSNFASAFKKILAAAAIGTTIAKIFKDSIGEGAQLQQSLGGVETLFKDSSDMVKKYANEAYKTVGLSANDYMENVTGFSASLLQSMGGDTKKAAKVANMAMIDMGDNANKMGTNMQDIQNAYQGFAKQNYTMLDNLKLGYGGTKTEMERLLKDATKLSGVKYDIDNLADVYSAINVIQKELDITGTTALEANETFSGSFAAMAASYQNLIGKMSISEDFTEDIKALAQTIATFLFGNLLPMVANVAKALPGALLAFAKEAAPMFLQAGKDFVANLSKGLTTGGLTGNALWISHAIGFVSDKLKTLGTEVVNRLDVIKVTFKKLVADIQPILKSFLGVVIGIFTTASSFLSVAIPIAIDFVLAAFEGMSSVIMPIVTTIADAIWSFSSIVSDAMMNYVIPALHQFSDWMKENPEKVENFGKALGAIAIGVGVFKTISTVIPVISTVIGTIKGLVTAFSMIKSAAGVLTLVKTGFATLVTAVGGPVTIIVGIIAGLVAAFVYLWKTNDDFKNAVINIWNGIVSFLTPVVQGISDYIKGVFDTLSNWWKANQQGIFNTAKTVWNTIKSVFSTVVSEISRFVQSIFGTLSTWWKNNQQSILNTAKMIWNAIKVTISIAIGAIQLVVTTVLTAIRAFWNTWGSAILTLVKIAWNAIKATFQSTLQSILTIVSSLMTQVRIVINTVMGVIQGIIKVITGLIKGDWSSVWNGIKQITSSIMNGIKNTIGNVLETAKTLVSGKIESIKGFFKSIGDVNLYQIGKDIIQGLINGVGSMVGAIGRKVSEITSGIKDKITGAFSIKSPSRWMRDFIGKNMMLGWGIGIDRNSQNPLNSIAKVTDSLMDEMKSSFSDFGLIDNAIDKFKSFNLNDVFTHQLITDGASVPLAASDASSIVFDVTNHIQSAKPVSERELARQQRLQMERLAYEVR